MRVLSVYSIHRIRNSLQMHNKKQRRSKLFLFSIFRLRLHFLSFTCPLLQPNTHFHHFYSVLNVVQNVPFSPVCVCVCVSLCRLKTGQNAKWNFKFYVISCTLSHSFSHTHTHWIHQTLVLLSVSPKTRTNCRVINFSCVLFIHTDNASKE